MRSLLLVAAVAIALIACRGGADTSQLGPAAPAPAQAATTTATQTINVDDMMGLYSQQTVFVASAGQISAVTLLNHFIRYRIPVGVDLVQAASDSPGEFFYVLDVAKETGVATADVRRRNRHRAGEPHRHDRAGVAALARDRVRWPRTHPPRRCAPHMGRRL